MAHLLDAEIQAVKVCCSTGSKQVKDASGLRCRFGSSTEVPAWMEGDTISCCAPTEEELRRKEGGPVVPLKIFENDRVLIERTYEATEPLCKTKPLDVDGATADQQPAQAPEGKDFGKMDGETTQEYLKREFSALKPFVIISLSYLLFTTTDGAVRMIVLLHAYNAGFTAWEVAIMFTLYELAGVVTNLMAGLMGSKWGIKWTLLTGLSLQLVGISVLYGWQPEWAETGNKWKAIVFVTFAQMLCGIAKDLTKLGGKTVTKLVTGEEKQTRLFKLVSLITGWKNSLKGIGYFIGAACLSVSYQFALAVLLVLILLAMPWAVTGLTSDLGRARKEDLTLARIFKQKYNINVLSLSRFFLFGSRDMWFEVPLPFFLRDSVYGLGWSRAYTGLFLASFIIVYGQIQSWTPQLVLGPLQQMPSNKYVAVLWNSLLVAPALIMASTLQFSDAFRYHDITVMTITVVLVLAGFCVLFAINSSIHSYLVVRYAEGDKVAMNVGFYYMANAMGRLTGTLASGMMYSFVSSNPVYGFAACFWASVAFVVASAAVEVALRDDVGGLRWGRFTLVAPSKASEHVEALALKTGKGDQK